VRRQPAVVHGRVLRLRLEHPQGSRPARPSGGVRPAHALRAAPRAGARGTHTGRALRAVQRHAPAGVGVEVADLGHEIEGMARRLHSAVTPRPPPTSESPQPSTPVRLRLQGLAMDTPQHRTQRPDTKSVRPTATNRHSAPLRPLTSTTAVRHLKCPISRGDGTFELAA
jgi:hypothetical protein